MALMETIDANKFHKVLGHISEHTMKKNTQNLGVKLTGILS
jgi:hypothetical protein